MVSDQQQRIDEWLERMAETERKSQLEEALDSFSAAAFRKSFNHEVTIGEGYKWNATSTGSDISITGDSHDLLHIRALGLHEIGHMFTRKVVVRTPAEMDDDTRHLLQNGMEDCRVENILVNLRPATTNFLRWLTAKEIARQATKATATNFDPDHIIGSLNWYLAVFGREHIPPWLKAKMRKFYESYGVEAATLDELERAAKAYLKAQGQTERDNVAIELTRYLNVEKPTAQPPPGGGVGGNYGDPKGGGSFNPGDAVGNAEKEDKPLKGEQKDAEEQAQQKADDLSSEMPPKPEPEQPEESEESGEGEGEGEQEQQPQSGGEGGQPEGQGDGEPTDQTQDGSGGSSGGNNPPAVTPEQAQEDLADLAGKLSGLMEDATSESIKELNDQTKCGGGISDIDMAGERKKHVEEPGHDMHVAASKLQHIINDIQIAGRTQHIRKAGRVHVPTLMRRTCAGKGVLTNLRVFKSAAQSDHGGKLHVFIALDNSRSMHGNGVDQAARFGWEVWRAVTQTGGQCMVSAFTTTPALLKNTPNECVIPDTYGGTSLSPILSDVYKFFSSAAPEDAKLFMVLTDCGLSDVEKTAGMFRLLRKMGTVIWIGAIGSPGAAERLKALCPFVNTHDVVAPRYRSREDGYGEENNVHDTLYDGAIEFLKDLSSKLGV
jgi:hypothetical protein